MITNKKQANVINIENVQNLLFKDFDKEEIKISIIIPVYNVEKYIENCINSILNNTFKNIEIICINDGSTDNSLKILNELSQKEKRLKVFSQNNQGAGAARNYGLLLAKGKYIYFMDSDDTIHKRALEYLFFEMEKNNLDMLMFSATTIFQSNKIKDKYYDYENAYKRNYDYSEINEGKLLFTEFVKNGELKLSPVLYILNKGFLDNNKICFKEGIIYEDNIFTIKCLTLAKRVAYKNIILYNRLIRNNSVMTSTSIIKSLKSILIVILELKKFAKKYKLKEFKQYYKALKKTYKKIIKRKYKKYFNKSKTKN